MSFIMRARTSIGAARIRAHMMAERWGEPQATTLADIPVSPDGVTKAWMAAALCRGVPGADIDQLEFGGGSVGNTARRLMTVTYNGAGRVAGLPTHLFVKATPEFMSRFVCGMTGCIANEVNFYNRIQPIFPIETPTCYYADFAPGSYRSIYVLENVSLTRGAHFLDPTHVPDRAQAEGMVRVMAQLHSRFWGDPILDRDFLWLRDSLTYQRLANDVIDYQRQTGLGLERAAAALPPRLAARKGELWGALMRSCALRAEAPRTLLHADIHIGNWYVTGAGTMGLCDWQCTVTGSWAADVAYALGCSLTVEDRRAWERDLLQLYLDELRLPAGYAKPSFDDAWLAYRQQTLHGLHCWLFVAGVSAASTALHSGATWMINLTRMAAAVDDLETLDSLR